MASTVKGVFLAIVLVSVILPLDGVDGLKCYQCDSITKCEKNCTEGINPKTRIRMCDRNDKCIKSTSKSKGRVGVMRDCFSIEDFILPGDCVTVESGGEVGVTCICDKDLCNSAGYLHGAPLFVVGLILLTSGTSTLINYCM